MVIDNIPKFDTFFNNISLVLRSGILNNTNYLINILTD